VHEPEAVNLTWLVDRLVQHQTLGSAPRRELDWLVGHARLRQLNTGEVLSTKGAQVQALYILLSGRLGLFVDRGSGPNKLMEWRGGDVAGMLPYSRLVTAPGNSIALEPLEVLAVPRECLPGMIRDCFEVTSILVHSMIDRARLFTSSDLQNEKMISLGKLSAGLAHELNNPSSAMERCAALLDRRIEECDEAARSLAAANLSATQIIAIDAVRASSMARANHAERSPLEQSDREEAIADWLTGHGLEMICAGMLADTEVTLEALQELAAAVPPQTLNPILQWAAAGCAVRNLSAKIQDCAMRISSLITAVKGFTHMDQANVAEPLPLGPGLAHTVAVLGAKAHQKSASVTLELQAELPKVRGFTAELNQVWGSLIDNALDAVANGGRVHVTASCDGRSVVVRILDDGPGIRAEIRDRVFDPFFTTKPRDRESAWVSTSSAVWYAITTARSNSNQAQGEPSFESACPSERFPRPECLKCGLRGLSAQAGTRAHGAGPFFAQLK
jgi:signal transduction histidine kinase